MKLRSRAKSDVGKQRETNEDRVFAGDEAQLYAVADGVGGRLAGDIAAELFIERVERAAAPFRELARSTTAPGNDLQERGLRFVQELFDQASETIYMEAQSNPRHRGMATTGVVLGLAGGRAFLGHVGDSRAYLLRGGVARQLTTDHTIGQSLLAEGLSLEQVERLMHRNVLTRTVGKLPRCRADGVCFDVSADDRFLLCTDGLTRYFGAEKLFSLAEGGVEELLSAALAAGGEDNVSVVLVDVVESDPRAVALDTEARMRALQDHFLFQHLSYQELLRTMRIIEELRFEPGDYVVREGEIGERIYSVIDGSLAVVKGGVTLTELPPGSGFGEIAFCDSLPRSASVVARTKATLLAIHRKSFEKLTREDGPIAWKLMWSFVLNLSGRLRTLTNDYVSGR